MFNIWKSTITGNYYCLPADHECKYWDGWEIVGTSDTYIEPWHEPLAA